VTAAVFQTWAGFVTLLLQSLFNKDRQCCESWRDAELRVHAVCAVGDKTDKDFLMKTF